VVSGETTAVAEAERESPAPHAPVPAVPEERAVAEPQEVPEPLSSIDTAPAAVEPEKPSTASSWFSTPPSPWDAEALKASQLASTWDNPVPATPSYGQMSAPDEIEVVPEAAASAIPVVAVEALRGETSQIVEQVAHEASESNASASAANAPQEAAASLNLDAVVARVLARMSPDVLQEVTREILKPLVEAIVREELKKP
jgi:hypothetical protein